jgi:hypothetical protein
MPRPDVAAQIDFERTTTEWFTPPEIFEAMEVEFDLDVASPGARKVPWIPARRHLTIRDDGLKQPWQGFVWMNCPFGLRNGMEQWIERFIEHGNGVALVVDFTSTEWWQHLTEHSDFILFVRPKIQFLPRSDGRMNCLGSTLVAIGDAGIRALRNAERNGRGICFQRARARGSIWLRQRSEVTLSISVVPVFWGRCPVPPVLLLHRMLLDHRDRVQSVSPTQIDARYTRALLMRGRAASSIECDIRRESARGASSNGFGACCQSSRIRGRSPCRAEPIA